MENLTTKEKEKIKKRLLRLAKVADDGEIGILQELNQIFEEVEALKEELTGKIERALEIAEETKKTEVVGPQGERGEKGEPGESITGPQGARGARGEKGAKGRDGFDGKNGESIVGPQGKDGKDGSPDTPEQVRDKLETVLNSRPLARKYVEGLDEELKEIRNLPRGGGASRRVFQPYRDDFSALTDGTTKIFYLTRAPLQTETAMVFGTDYPTILRPTIDFNITNKTLTLTDQVPAPSVGATLLATYFS